MAEPLVFALPSSPKQSRARAFSLSLSIHAVAVALLRTASHSGWLAVPPSAYRERIARQEHRIIWYTPAAELPPVAPANPAPRIEQGVEHRHPQRLMVWAPKPESRRQMILQSPPEMRIEQDLSLPNALLWTAPVAPPPPPKPRFELPQRARATARPAELLPAPTVSTNTSSNTAIPLEPIPLPPRRRFELPATLQRAASGPALVSTEAPQVEPALVDSSALARIQPVTTVARPRFVMSERSGSTAGAPGRKATVEDAPPVQMAAAGQPNLVVVGLDAAPGPIPLPPPPGNRSAQFSAGPDGNGGDGAASSGASAAAHAELRIPNLAIAPAAAPTITRPPLPTTPDRSAFRRQLLSSLSVERSLAGPDAVLRGSTVYTLAIDMPNITSQEGSWIVRFTELGGSSPEDVLTSPVATRKVDPKYIAAAAAEGIQGKVLLYAVIRRDGRVDRIRLVQGIDERLDSSAIAAFSKWEFQPATKNGQPVDLEAVVQIPFRLNHKP